jgi:hypothetical protein
LLVELLEELVDEDDVCEEPVPLLVFVEVFVALLLVFPVPLLLYWLALTE